MNLEFPSGERRAVRSGRRLAGAIVAISGALVAGMPVATTAAGDPPAGDPPAGGPPSGGLGQPPSSHPGRPNPAAGGGAGGAPQKPRERQPEAPEPARGKTVVLPHPGSYRAPGILRLAAELWGLPVRVESKELNDITIEIPARLARRPVTRDEMRILLAADQLFLHLWEHPEHGALLVASHRADWTPGDVTYRKILAVDARDFDATWASIEATVAARNAGLAPRAARLVAVPHARTGKIFLWSPRSEWLDDLVVIHARVEETSDAGRLHLHTYRARHRLATALEPELLAKLSAGEKERLRLRPVRWGNHLIFSAERELAAKVQHLLEKLDRPTRSAQRDSRNPAARESAP